MRYIVLVCILCSLAGPAPAPRPDDGPLASHSVRLAIRRLTTDVAKLGRPKEVRRLRSLLERLGDSPDDLEKLDERWTKDIQRARPDARREARTAKNLRGEADRLAARISDRDPSRRRRLAEAVLEIDSEEARANEALGRTLVDGRWMSPESIARAEAKARISDLISRARRLEFPVVHEQSQLPGLDDLYGGQSVHTVRVRGIVAHGIFEPAKLERIVVDALQAAALSNALRGGELGIPPKLLGKHFLLLESKARYEAALDEALRHQGISAEQYDDQRTTDYGTFFDHRGWVTSRWRTEAGFKALVLSFLVSNLLGRGTQPCLEAGHVNWLTMNLFGTSLPTFAPAELERTAADPDEARMRQALWRSTNKSLYGCRSWMILRVEQGSAPPWSRAMTEHLSEIRGEALLKTTLVNGFLQESGTLDEILRATQGATDRIPAFERALGRELAAFEEEWALWLAYRDAGSPPGVVQTLEGRASVASDDLGARMAAAINGMRASALSGQHAEFQDVRPFPDLADGARAHASYLARHEDQQSRWPDLHEEYSDREGFSAAGSWAGLHSLIHFVADPEEAVREWAGTFYHRLPLLYPGLFGIGVGYADGVMVLDVGSLVLDPWREHWVAWPPEGARDVPLRFVPEIPNPLPGEDQTAWGYPVTLQVFVPNQDRELELILHLYRGESAQENAVDCHFISPLHPEFPQLAPTNTWCLIPKAALAADTIYTVVAEGPDVEESRTWRFRTR